MKRIVVYGLIIIIAISGCTRKKNDRTNTGRFEGSFAYEKRVLLDMIDILHRYNSRILMASTTEEITNANEEFCNKLEILNPEIKFVTEKHPDWEDNPPEEMKSIIQEYMKANREFGTLSLDIVNNKIKSHPDNKDLIRSYERLSYLIAPEDKDM